MIGFRQRAYVAAKLFRTLGAPDFNNLWRAWNALCCVTSRNGLSPARQPFFAQIEPTTICNLRCRFCLNPALPDPRSVLSYDRFIQILDSFPGLLIINLQGLGEPTLNKDLFRMATEARRRKIYVYTVTNLNLPERVVHRIAESDFNGVNISVESVEPGRYAWYRLGGDFARLESNLRLLAALRKTNGKDFTIGLWATVTNDTVDSLEDIFKFAASTGGVDRIQVQLLQNKDNYVVVYDDALKDQQFSNLQEGERKLRQLLRDFSRRYKVSSSLVGGKCRWPWGGLFINAEGLLAPCCNIKDYKDPLWGDLAQGSSGTAWHSAEWTSLRGGLLTGDFHRSCVGCPSARA